ncbi:hypothetical protein PHMEG_0006725 [Phytophthora megakarya]|uniref:Reverse transcriptase n=1 Tax=Phytophthora megakarya TaxID=4795 RepID=A0A225WQ11_9STRA|nr:hypothetical protein PHMEG_0006725 [Phytophthora megakarya]
MTERPRKDPAFVCALGHFEWSRTPFGLNNAPMIYQRMMDKALWGAVGKNMRFAEENVERTKTGVTGGSTRPRSKFEADRESASNPDPVSELANSPTCDIFSNGEPDESSLFSFPTSKKGMHRFIYDFAVYAVALYQLREEDDGPSGDLSVTRQSFAKLQQKIIDAPILRHFDRWKKCM